MAHAVMSSIPISMFHTLVNLTMPASNGDYRKAVKALISGYLTRSTHDEN